MPPQYGTSNQSGTAPASTLAINVSGLPIVRAPFLTGNTHLVLNGEAAGWHEDGPFPVSAEDVAKLGQNVGDLGVGRDGDHGPDRDRQVDAVVGAPAGRPSSGWNGRRARRSSHQRAPRPVSPSISRGPSLRRGRERGLDARLVGIVLVDPLPAELVRARATAPASRRIPRREAVARRSSGLGAPDRRPTTSRRSSRSSLGTRPSGSRESARRRARGDPRARSPTRASVRRRRAARRAVRPRRARRSVDRAASARIRRRARPRCHDGA